MASSLSTAFSAEPAFGFGVRLVFWGVTTAGALGFGRGTVPFSLRENWDSPRVILRPALNPLDPPLDWKLDLDFDLAPEFALVGPIVGPPAGAAFAGEKGDLELMPITDEMQEIPAAESFDEILSAIAMAEQMILDGEAIRAPFALVPEPCAFALSMMGLICLLVCALRKRRNA